MMRRFIGLLLAALIVAVALASPATADVEVSAKVVVDGERVSAMSPLSPVKLVLADTGTRRVHPERRGETCAQSWARWDAYTKSVVETRVGAAKMTRRWCYNGTRVTSVGATTIDHWVTDFGTLAQVTDEGICCRAERWTSWHQTYHGGHVAKATSHFHQAVPTPLGEISIADWYLLLKIEVFGNGRDTWSGL